MSTRSPSATSSPAHRLDRLQHRHALTGQRRLLDLQRRGHEQATVGRHLVTCLEDDGVSGHELLGGNVAQLTAAADVGHDHEHLLQGGDALGRLALLVQAEDRVDHGHAEDDEARAELLQRDDAHDRRSDEDELHEVAVLAQECVPAGLLLRLGQLVRTVLLAAALDLGGIEPFPRIDSELRTRLVCRQPVPYLVPRSGLIHGRRSYGTRAMTSRRSAITRFA